MSQRNDDEPPVLPDQTQDDTDRGWGDERPAYDAEDEHARRLEEDRPPHWDRAD